jgi:hypothetical protein
MRENPLNDQPPGQQPATSGRLIEMLKLSLVALFVAIMATLTIAASAMPVPPQIEGSTILVADLS